MSLASVVIHFFPFNKILNGSIVGWSEQEEPLTIYQDMNDATWNNFDISDSNNWNTQAHRNRQSVNMASIIIPAVCLVIEGAINKIHFPIGLGYIHMAY
jgi:hypothetical protein